MPTWSLNVQVICSYAIEFAGLLDVYAIRCGVTNTSEIFFTNFKVVSQSSSKTIGLTQS